MLVSSVVGAFESVVAVLPIVICFQSMVLDMAGNVGTQSLAVTIRVLVDENLTTAKKLQLLWKEMRVGLTNGALLAVLALGFLGCYIHFFKAAWGKPSCSRAVWAYLWSWLAAILQPGGHGHPHAVP